MYLTSVSSSRKRFDRYPIIFTTARTRPVSLRTRERWSYVTRTHFACSCVRRAQATLVQIAHTSTDQFFFCFFLNVLLLLPGLDLNEWAHWEFCCCCCSVIIYFSFKTRGNTLEVVLPCTGVSSYIQMILYWSSYMYRICYIYNFFDVLILWCQLYSFFSFFL